MIPVISDVPNVPGHVDNLPIPLPIVENANALPDPTHASILPMLSREA